MKIAWVIGRGGLLGSALERSLLRAGTRLFVPTVPFRWRDVDAVQRQLRCEATRFAVAAEAAASWEIHWAAGVGTMGSRDDALATETVALRVLLEALPLTTLRMPFGRFAFASSAGALYAGSSDAVITEDSQPLANNAYARAKLQQEQLLHDFAERCPAGVLISRISTLYGSGQATDKAQGLLTHISRCLIRNEPVQIFVPLDTIRDYIAADDAASMMTAALASIDRQVVTKIVASERPVTISEILSIFKRLARRSPRIVTSGSAMSSVYTRRIQFRSVVPPHLVHRHASFFVGIGNLLADERLRFVSAAGASGKRDH